MYSDTSSEVNNGLMFEASSTLNEDISLIQDDTRAEGRTTTYTDDNDLLLYLSNPDAETPTILYRLSQERLARNRCVSNLHFFLLYLLLRLWIEALATFDINLIILSVSCTAWLVIDIYRKRRDWEREITLRTEDFISIVGDHRNVVLGGQDSREELSWREENGINENSKKQWVFFRWKTQYPNYGSIPSFETSDLEKQTTTTDNSNDDVCSICLCEYENDSRCVRIQCSHVYHEDCLMLWAKNHNRCPLCNFNMNE